MIGSIVKYFRFSWHEVMFGISYTNLMMLLATIPEFKKKEDKEEEIFDDEIMDEETFNKMFKR